MQEGTKVKGTYFGHKFTGTIAGIWFWNDIRHGSDSIFVTLDSPIVVNGIERKLVCVKEGNGEIEPCQ